MSNSFSGFLYGMIALAGWFALTAQFWLMMQNRVADVQETITRFFSYFTILTNLLVATCCTTLAFKKKSFFSKSGNITAVATYIIIVGIVYNIILRFLWQPQGLQWLVDELLHTVIPFCFVITWYFFADKQGLKWNSFYYWLLYPFLYLVFILIRGAISGFYPYPFIDVNTLGYPEVIVNALGLLLFFVLISLLFIFIARKKTPV